IDESSFLQIVWQLFIADGVEDQPQVAARLPLFGRAIWLHSFQTVEYLPHQLIARTLGLHQPIVDLTRPTHPRRHWRFSGFTDTDWVTINAAAMQDWEAGGTEVTSDAASNTAYVGAFREHYRTHLHLGSSAEVPPVLS